MSRKTLSFAEADMDWKPLEAILSEDDQRDWMWMHCDVSPATGAVVHFYKHVWSRRYLRIDGEGRVYRERRDGTPDPLPACGGGTLITQLMRATAPYGDGMPSTITLPEAAREPAGIEDVASLAELCELFADDLYRMIEDVDHSRALLSDGDDA